MGKVIRLTESDLKRIIERVILESNEDKILMLPNPDRIGGWNILQQLLEMKGNPRYGIRSDLDLTVIPIKSLGNLERVEGSLNLSYTPIESLGNLKYVQSHLDLRYSVVKSLGNLEYVGGDLDLYRVSIESLGNLEYVGGYLDLYGTTIESLGDLKHVGGNLDLRLTPLSKITTEEEIRSKVNVGGNIHLIRGTF